MTMKEYMKYTPVIGLEVHVELKTKSKMFCSCSADYFGKEPNTHTCPVCLGLPGALPVPNAKAIEWCVMIGMALNCSIPDFAKFDRKNYFYPDLAKGYQISQYDQPFAINGLVILNSFQDPKQKKEEMPKQVRHDKEKRIRIRRVHMEEDTGKLIHQGDTTLIDFNRSGVPLVEIVTDPDFSASEDVVLYLKKLQQIVRYLNVSNADMEKGDMRLEPNISLRLEGETSLPKYKVEVKNINSFRFVEKAIHFEIKRQAAILDEGKTPVQETRGWDEKIQGTVSQRLKEEANDYRYFPEPDIPPVRWTELQIRQLADQMPELPQEKFDRFINEYSLSDYDAEILTRKQATADYFEQAVKVNNKTVEIKTIANWITNKKADITSVSPEELIMQIGSATQTTPVDNTELEKVVDEILSENQKAVDDYKKGKTNVIGFLIGMTKRKLGPQSDTNQIKGTIEKALSNK